MNVTEVVAALIWKENRFLACQRPKHKVRALLWEFVGGKVEAGESKEDALIRECYEELAIQVIPKSIFMDVLHEYSDMLVHLTVYNAVIAEGEPVCIEHNALQWLLPNEIDLYDFCPADDEILLAIKAINNN